jgi:integration host factor subunit alpha
MAALTKIELANNIHEVLGFNKRESMDIIECFFEEMRNVLQQGKEVKLSGFGNFYLRDKSERPGRNPKTGKIIPVSSRRVVTFHAGQKLKEQVKQYVGTNDKTKE